MGRQVRVDPALCDSPPCGDLASGVSDLKDDLDGVQPKPWPVHGRAPTTPPRVGRVKIAD